MPHAISTEPLVQMLKSISLQKRTGLLKVESLGEKRIERGEIYFDSGHPMLIRTSKETGKEAFQLMSSWKHIVCSFQGMSKQYPGNLPALGMPRERETGKEPLVRLLPPGTNNRQTGQISHPAVPGNPGAQPQVAPPIRPDPATNARMPMPFAQPNRFNTSTNLRTPLPPVQLSPARGNTPTRSERPEPARQNNQRWTTPLTPEVEQPPILRKPPITPRLGLDISDGEDFLTDRMGVFKARSMITTMQGIQQMERRERIIYVLLDGYRTIQDIARLTHRSEGEVEQTLLELTHRGYTEYAGKPQHAPMAHEKMANLFRDEYRA
jgi:hypothetical protein